MAKEKKQNDKGQEIENIIPYEADPERWKAISRKVIRYRRKANKKENIGIQPSELEPLFPELVEKHPEGYLKIDYEKLSVICLRYINYLHEELTKKGVL